MQPAAPSPARTFSYALKGVIELVGREHERLAAVLSHGPAVQSQSDLRLISAMRFDPRLELRRILTSTTKYRANQLASAEAALARQDAASARGINLQEWAETLAADLSAFHD
jgi:hypothetical protein